MLALITFQNQEVIMPKAFLSHSTDDKQIVRKIKEKIGRTWTYFDEDSFAAGEDFREAITNRLADTNLFVLFVSKSSLQSSWVKYELDETYWQVVQRDNISVLVLTLDDIEVTQLPNWMRKAKFDKVSTPYLAAQKIKNILFEKSKIESDIYIGREKDILKFYNDLIERRNSFPNIFAITGLSGIGRRTFIKDILSNRFSLKFTVEFQLSTCDGLSELYRKLLDDNIESLSPDEIIAHDRWVQSQPLEKSVVEVARVLSLYTLQGACPIIVDNGTMLDDNGFYKQEFYLLLKEFACNHKDQYIVLIQNRVPQLNYEDYQLVYNFKIFSLDSNSCYSLFDALLKKNGVSIPNIEQVKEISEYLEGYPPSIIYATKQCVLDGVDVVCHDKVSLMDYQSRLFSKYLEKTPLDALDLSLLTVIYNLESLAISPLATILQKEEMEVTASLKKCLNFSIIDVNIAGTYTIAPPIRAAIGRKVHRFNKTEFSTIATLLIQRFWIPEKAEIDFSIIDLIINSILRSDQEDDLVKFKTFILPSHLLKAAEKANEDTDWPLAEKYARKALNLQPSLHDAQVLLFKVLVRQEHPKNIQKSDEEEEKILNELAAVSDKRYYYLRGFRLWKRHRFYQAIDEFELAKAAGDDSIQMHRDLAECYYQTNQFERAQNEIELVMKTRKISNPFILDLATKISIETGEFEKASELLEQQSLVDRFENVAHRRATFFIKKGDFKSALEYATIACNGERVLPQMHLLRMSIGIHLRDYEIAEHEYKFIKDNYVHFSVDICETLYATMLLYKRGWKLAEAAFTKIKRQDSSFAQNLRCKILDEKIKDPTVSPIEKEKLEKERTLLRAKKLSDLLLQIRYYDL